jgi:hypothetical protein
LLRKANVRAKLTLGKVLERVRIMDTQHNRHLCYASSE